MYGTLLSTCVMYCVGNSFNVESKNLSVPHGLRIWLSQCLQQFTIAKLLAYSVDLSKLKVLQY